MTYGKRLLRHAEPFHNFAKQQHLITFAGCDAQNQRKPLGRKSTFQVSGGLHTLHPSHGQPTVTPETLSGGTGRRREKQGNHLRNTSTHVKLERAQMGGGLGTANPAPGGEGGGGCPYSCLRA